MRLLGCLMLSCLVPAVALAEGGVTVVDDEPMSHVASASPARAVAPRAAASRVVTPPHAPSETGQLRPARVAAPDPVAVDSGGAVAREHDVAQPHSVDEAAIDGDTMAELAARQLARETRRHQRDIDGCLAAAHKRAPAAAGTITLDFDVAAKKLQSVAVSDDGVHDAQLSACLTRAARGFSFSLASARFHWPVALRP